MIKKNTPYEVSLASKICMYCGAVFTSTKVYKDKRYYTISALRQLETHYLSEHKRT